MGKPNYLLEHFADPKNWDPTNRVPATAGLGRLTLWYAGKPGTWADVARAVTDPRNANAAWFPDANVAFLPATTPVWDALRVAALGCPAGTTILSGVAEAEMQEWLADPYRLKDRAAAIRTALAGRTWVRRFRVANDDPLNVALVDYTHLLGFRRLLARPLPDGTTFLGAKGADKSASMNAVRNYAGPRALGLVKKGRTDFEATGQVNISDEMHCLMAIFFALRHRRPTVILTADDDHREIFYKAQYLIDMHYRAWLLARLVAAGEYGEPAGEMTDTDGHFTGPLTLYRRRTTHLREALPPEADAVPVSLIYVAPDGLAHVFRFAFEVPMLDTFATRSKTHGRCTDLFGESNIHVDLGPLKRKLEGLYLGIGRDAVHEFSTNGVRSSISWMDLQHSAACCETFGLSR
jgi:hypothetical protein